MKSNSTQYDVCILGSGFAGSLLAWILASANLRVVLVDRGLHPRFAIGESSTPLADFLMEQIADEYQLPGLKSLCRWGSWQRELPHLRAGKKRGFSYYAHRAGQPFSEAAPIHDASLLVAASSHDEVSDTHWMRSDVDQWFFQQAALAGAHVLEQFKTERVTGEAGAWKVSGQHAQRNVELNCAFIVDSSGAASVLAASQGIQHRSNDLRVQTGAIFGHFRNVASMTTWLDQHHMSTQGDPFDGDDAAQHHLLLDDRCWLWMLRFVEGSTSVGVVLPNWALSSTPAQEQWETILQRYPTVAELMADAQGVATDHSPPQLHSIPRVSRLLSQAAGQGWAMLPGTVGSVDPLHSTGIAHALSGVSRIARMLLGKPPVEREGWQAYSRDVVAEVMHIDRIVAGCYRASQDSFELFAAVCSVYFIAAIQCERGFAATGNLRDGFLLQKSAAFNTLLEWLEPALESLLSARDRNSARRKFVDQLRTKLEPWNDVGLQDPRLNHRIARSSSTK